MKWYFEVLWKFYLLPPQFVPVLALLTLCWGSARFAAGYRSRIWTCECESVPRFWFWVWLFDVNSCRRYDFHRFVRYEVVLLKEKRILDKNKVPTTYLYRLAATGTNKLSSTNRISAPIKRDNETFNYVNWLEQSLCISVLTNKLLKSTQKSYGKKS